MPAWSAPPGSTSPLPFALRPVSPEPVPCKICDAPAGLYGVVDFHKSCEERRGLRLPLAGVPVYYRHCTACGFLFTDAFDDWSTDDFKAHIYNDGYHAVDPDYETARPSSNVDLVAGLWGAYKADLKVLDFGGGNDVLCAGLRTRGFPVAVTYDPMVPAHAQRPDGKFDLVTCFETFEHLPDPAAGIARILECVAEPGLIFYSTLTLPSDFEQHGLAWWYVGPRNGHISLFTRKALAMAWGRRGYKSVSFSENAHLAFRTLPPFLSQLQARADRLLAIDDAVASSPR
jgi:2-polyprenyl-6-hydroxyphenyl methylase/3-demethylubiquinone-9 3-methyltransferase